MQEDAHQENEIPEDRDQVEETKQVDQAFIQKDIGSPSEFYEKEPLPESAQFIFNVNAKYRESVENILDTAKSFFLNEFQEVLFDTREPSEIEQKLASEPGLLISLFTHMHEQRKRRRNKNNRVTFSTVEEIASGGGAISDSLGLDNSVPSDGSLRY